MDRLLDDLIRKSRASSCLIAALVKGAKIAYFDGREWLPIDNSTLSDTVFYSPSRVILPTRGRFRRRVIFNGISARAYKLPPLEQATLDPTLTF